MALLRNIASGFRSLFRKERVGQELDEEVSGFLEMAAEEKMKQGMSRKDALRVVRLERGNLGITKEVVRSAGWESVLETCWHDLRFASRMLRKNLGFTSVAVLIMALGIGANAAMFSVVNAVLLRPLSFNEPERIVTLASLWAQSEHGPVSAPDFRDWHDQSTAFEAMAYYQDRDTAIMAGTLAEYGQVAMVSREFFQVFHVQPAIGREFNADETKAGSGGAAMVSCDFAVSHYRNPTNALGQKIRMFDRTLDVVGVLPPGFHFPNKTDIWFPANTIFRDNENRGGHNYLVVGKLKPGVTLEQAQAQMAAIGARLEARYSDSNTNESVAVARMRDDMVGNFQLTLWVMLATVGVVLLSHEIGVRMALGAHGGNILNLILGHGARLAAAGVGIGISAAFAATRLMSSLLFGVSPFDAVTFIGVALLLMFVALAACYFPAHHAMRVDPMVALGFE